MTHEVLRRPADLYEVAPRAQALSHRGRDAAFHYDHGLVPRNSIEIPAGTRDPLLRIQAAVSEIEKDLQLRLDLPSPPMHPPPARVTIVGASVLGGRALGRKADGPSSRAKAAPRFCSVKPPLRTGMHAPKSKKRLWISDTAIPSRSTIAR
jgi:hypothetical protein